MIKALVYRFLDKLIEWIFRRRSPATPFFKYGVALAGAALGVDIIASLIYADATRFVFIDFSTGGGLPEWVILICFWLGILLIITGASLSIYYAVSDIRTESRKKVIVVELRGLHSSPDTVAKDIVLDGLTGKREWFLLDLREKLASSSNTNPDVALVRIRGLLPAIQVLADGRDKTDISIALGGLAPVPLLFLAGLLIDDENHTTVFDWDRNLKKWVVPNGIDDGSRIKAVDFSSLDASDEEIILSISLSYLIKRKDLVSTFGGELPVVEICAEEVLVDKYWSVEKQASIVQTIRDHIQTLLHHGVKKIHLVLAAPSSLSIKIGMSYDQRLFPKIVVYQFEPSNSPPYPWGILMPTHGVHEPIVIRSPIMQPISTVDA